MRRYTGYHLQRFVSGTLVVANLLLLRRGFEMGHFAQRRRILATIVR